MTWKKNEALCPEQQGLVDELLTHFDGNELADIARKLPYNANAAKALYHTIVACQEPMFLLWLLGRPAVPERSQEAHWRPLLPARPGQKKEVVAVYIAAAAQYFVGKRLLEVKALSEQKLKIIQGVNTMLHLAEDHNAPLLSAAFKEGGKKALQETRTVTEDDGEPD